jgi:hypothetical protein
MSMQTLRSRLSGSTKASKIRWPSHQSATVHLHGDDSETVVPAEGGAVMRVAARPSALHRDGPARINKQSNGCLEPGPALSVQHELGVGHGWPVDGMPFSGCRLD